MRKCITLSIVCFLTLAANALQLSDQAKISLLTCSPGAELYSTFGHSAIRVQDPAKKIDWVYNYGTFQFSDDFYVKFAQGKLNYRLSKSTFTDFVNEYIYYGRQVEEQVFLLSRSNLQLFFDALEENYKPENRTYRYDFFFDNCSTRILDIVESTLDGEIKFNDPLPVESMTFREMIDSYQGHMPWGDFGIDLALGTPCDRYMVHPEQTFIPDYLRDAFATMTYNGKPIVSEAREIIPLKTPKETNLIDWPLIVAWSLFAFNLFWALMAVTMKKDILGIDITFLVIYGIIGLLVFLLWFATDHTITKGNM
ncbi:MAG: DUF4105 domain-containing protein, partial [Bacteroidota bacterium]